MISTQVEAEARRDVRAEITDHERQIFEHTVRVLRGLVVRVRRRRQDAHRDGLRHHQRGGQREEAQCVVPAERRDAVDPVVREPLGAPSVVVGRALEVREPEEALACVSTVWCQSGDAIVRAAYGVDGVERDAGAGPMRFSKARFRIDR